MLIPKFQNKAVVHYASSVFVTDFTFVTVKFLSGSMLFTTRF